MSNSGSICLKLRLSKRTWMQRMWYLIEDFFEQSLVMKAIIGWGWLSILIMVTSVVFA